MRLDGGRVSLRPLAAEGSRMCRARSRPATPPDASWGLAVQPVLRRRSAGLA